MTESLSTSSFRAVVHSHMVLPVWLECAAGRFLVEYSGHRRALTVEANCDCPPVMTIDRLRNGLPISSTRNSNNAPLSRPDVNQGPITKQE